MQTTTRDLRTLCITRLKSDDFGFPQTRRNKPTSKLLGFILLALLTVIYTIVGDAS